ncbi:MAG: hypothetical protein WEC15_00825 [Flavobacteriales bacterium]
MALRFLLQSFGWAMPIAIGLTGYLLWNRDYIPAPRYTSNMALNEQIYRVAGMQQQTSIMAIGSSMTLNNLASTPVVDHFGTSAYVNVGAWGMGVTETAQLASDLVARLAPSKVIIVTNLMDFHSGSSLSDGEVEAVRKCLEDGGSMLDYFRYWDAAWFLRQMDLNRIRFTDRGNYEFLGFDEHGAATLEVPPHRILRSRFDEKPPADADIDHHCYAVLDSLAIWFREQDIELIVLQSPYRQGLLTPALKDINEIHAARLRQILESSGHQFVNGNALEWPDSVFYDASHLDRAGAEAFTRWTLEQLER